MGHCHAAKGFAVQVDTTHTPETVETIKLAADGLLVELVSDQQMEETRKTHDEMDEWLEKNWGRPGEDRAEASKDVSKRTIMSVVDPKNLGDFINNLELGSSMHPDTVSSLKKALQNIVLSSLHSDSRMNIKMDSNPGGTRYLEKFAVRSKKLQNGHIALALSFFSDVRTLDKDWLWLVNNHKTEKLQQWLDYKLHKEVEKKALALSNSGDYQ